MKTLSSKQSNTKPFELLLDQDRIARRIAELGTEISRDYAGQSLVLVGVLKGCLVFLADLMRQISLPTEIEFISAASYRKGIRQEEDVILGGGVSIPLKGRHVLMVEGIVESGKTIAVIAEKLRKMEPASVSIVTLLDKPSSRRATVDIKYKGFAIGNDFVIGFGLDNTQQYRNLPFIGRLVDH
ncbi:MAG: hypoxanthine phosphoribosyltransferase [candidate division Zixibacteria bacterium]|nr:hypoxanthine phosphoribosyltransferase [candidate division Zixibacteria bacterium]